MSQNTAMSARDVRELMDDLHADDTDRRCTAVAWLANLVEGCPDALVHALGFDVLDEPSEKYLKRGEWEAWLREHPERSPNRKERRRQRHRRR